MPRPVTRSRSVVRESSPPSDVDSFDHRGVDTSVDFPDPAGLAVPCFISSKSPALLGNDDSEILSPSSIRIPIEDAAVLAENVPGVILQTPQAPRRVRSRSGDSSVGQPDFPKRKKGKKKAADHLPHKLGCPHPNGFSCGFHLAGLMALPLSHWSGMAGC
ncbi:hypothetical protein PAXRUDRAFT_824965 [Paxillus rubicundulus Ve08.2h10]|uniref:Uncharacterized protein n=1 Tax=Paxillus rubicundulus Ve08.2h10 TaxID=930991 RepID=A0A0D0EBC5_9AGAM|nr:hypothetical protein PAXRUDRAFT_824965 [Paxillus rubicundulus Ve08.2h10]